MLSSVENTAVRACLEGGRHLAELFGQESDAEFSAHDVKLDGRMDEAKRLQDALADTTKRVVESWSPCVHWGALARGRFDGMVCFYPDDEEQHVGELLASEAGAAVSRPCERRYVAATTPEVRDDLVAALE